MIFGRGNYGVKPMPIIAVETRASLIPPVTSFALTPTLPISIKENELINPKTVPNNPKRGAIEIVVAKKLLNFSNSYCKDCIDIDNAIERFL